MIMYLREFTNTACINQRAPWKPQREASAEAELFLRTMPALLASTVVCGGPILTVQFHIQASALLDLCLYRTVLVLYKCESGVISSLSTRLLGFRYLGLASALSLLTQNGAPRRRGYIVLPHVGTHCLLEATRS